MVFNCKPRSATSRCVWLFASEARFESISSPRRSGWVNVNTTFELIDGLKTGEGCVVVERLFDQDAWYVPPSQGRLWLTLAPPLFVAPEIDPDVSCVKLDGRLVWD